MKRFTSIESIRRIAALAVCAIGVSAPALCGEAAPRTYVVDGKPVRFLDFPEKHLMISESCGAPDGKRLCEAYGALGRVSFHEFAATHRRGNPGAVICATQTRGKVVISRDDKGNETSFCEFKDGSMVVTGSLARAAYENDVKKR